VQGSEPAQDTEPVVAHGELVERPPSAPDPADADAEERRESVDEPAKVMRIGAMIRQLLEEVRAAPLDEASRARLKEIHRSSVKELEDGLATVDRFRLVDAHAGRSMIELVIHEGRKHIVRRLLEEVGHPVLRLLRTAVGEVQLGNQRPGRFRRLSHGEIGALYRSVGL